MYKAFQGANGWYVAFERRDGSHRQPSLGPWLSEAEAKAKARDGNDCDTDMSARLVMSDSAQRSGPWARRSRD